jgi:hypothetical protein
MLYRDMLALSGVVLVLCLCYAGVMLVLWICSVMFYLNSVVSLLDIDDEEQNSYGLQLVCYEVLCSAVLVLCY